MLTRINSQHEAIVWLRALEAWHQQFQDFLQERTLTRTWTMYRRAHEHVWKAHRCVKAVTEQGQLFLLFTFLDDIDILTYDGVVPVSSLREPDRR